MNILIIGSKGFIGLHCVDYFSKDHEVWQCDVVTDYTTRNYFTIDATNADYTEVFKDRNFDVCINCSGAASVPDSIKNPLRDFNLNVTNVFKQLNTLRKLNPSCKYINLSSAAVYGNPEYLPIDEAHPCHPISPYGRHKKMAEDICEEFNKNYQLKTCSLRIFSAYGEGLRKQLFWDLYSKSKTSETVILYGTGNESRDFIHVSDVVQAITVAIESSNFEADIINVANGKEISIQDAVAAFYNELDDNSKFRFGGEKRVGDPINWVANIDRLEEMGYRIKVELESGLLSYVAWLNDNA